MGLGTSQINDIDLSSGIFDEKYFFKNILIDLLYQDIPDYSFNNFPIGYLFGFEYSNNKLRTLKSLNNKNVFSVDLIYDKAGYFGNYNTYQTLKELLKLYIDGISLYYYKGEVLTYR
jgi:hypothetical protein